MVEELKIIVADDQERVRYGLRALLRQHKSWKVIGEAESAKQLFALISVLDPDLILLDWHLPDMPGETVLLSLQKICQNLPVIVISGKIEVKNAALTAGANAFVSKTSPTDQLVEIIQNVIENRKRRRK